MKWKLLLVIVGIQIGYIVFLCFHIRDKNNNNTLNVFTIKNKYYQYPAIKGLNYFYELKEGIGKMTDLTNIPSWLKKNPTYHINTDGLHEEKDYPLEKPQNTFRIVTLGDSFTFGLFLNTSESWPRRLQDLVSKNRCEQKIEVINLGLGGYDAEYEAERFVRRGAKYKPDLVLWLVKDNNFLWLNEYLHPLLLKYERELISTNERSNTESLLWQKVLENAKKDYTKQISFTDISRIGDTSLSLVSNVYKGPVILLNLPEYSTDKRIEAFLRNFIARHKGWRLYSNLPEIIRLGGTFPESHPNSKGYMMIAEDIFSYLQKNKLIRCTIH